MSYAVFFLFSIDLDTAVIEQRSLTLNSFNNLSGLSSEEMPGRASSSSEVVLKKLLTSARRLRYRGKHARARSKLQLALRLTESYFDDGGTSGGKSSGTSSGTSGGTSDGTSGDGESILYTPQELRLALADCLCREADEVRRFFILSKGTSFFLDASTHLYLRLILSVRRFRVTFILRKPRLFIVDGLPVLRSLNLGLGAEASE